MHREIGAFLFEANSSDAKSVGQFCCELRFRRSWSLQNRAGTLNINPTLRPSF